MNTTSDYQIILRGMLTESKLAQQFLEGVSYDEFLVNAEKKRAVECSLVWLGEGARKLPNAIRERRAELHSGELIEWGDKLTYTYFSIDYHGVWQYVKRELPMIENCIERMLVDA